MGQVINAYGIRGWIRVYPYTEMTDGLLAYGSWWLGETHSDWIEVPVETGRAHGELLDVKLKACHDRNQALKFKGLKIAVPRAQLPDLPSSGEGGYYWSDLIGVEVVNLREAKLGTVIGLFETGANDVLRVQSVVDAREILIPFIESTVIKNVDLVGAQIIADWELDY